MSTLLQQVVGEIKTLVDENPSFIYRGPGPRGTCKYVHQELGDGPTSVEFKLVPGCIVGHWLHRIRGVSLQDIAQHEDHGAAIVLQELTDRGLLPKELLADPIEPFLSKLQEKQDDGWEWRKAFEWARDYGSVADASVEDYDDVY